MKRLYGSHDPILLASLRDVLEANHIACVTRNDFLLGAAGELPPTECWPEIWVMEDWQLERARALVEAFLEAADIGASAWTCPRCRENVESQFSQCWHCGAERPLDDRGLAATT